MLETMLKILKSIKNSLLILIFLTITFVEAKNSKDVSNIKSSKKGNISHRKKKKIFFAISK